MPGSFRNAYSASSGFDSGGRSRSYRSSYGGVGSGRLGMGRGARGGKGAGGFFGAGGRGPFRPIPLPRGRSVPSIPLGRAVSRAGGVYGAVAYYVVKQLAMTVFLDSVYGWIDTPGDGTYEVGNYAGWNVLCSTDPNNFPTEFQRKLGYTPPPVGGVNLASTNCTVSGPNRANAPWGSAIPAGRTRVVLSQAAPPNLPNTGRPFEIWTRATPSPVAIPYSAPQVAIPLAMEYPEPPTYRKMQPGGGVKPPYFPGVNAGVEFSGGGWRPSGPHKPVPPRPGEREVKVNVPLPRGMRETTKAFHNLTEVQDAAECLFKALPAAIRRKYSGGLHMKIAAVTRHMGQIDWSSAVMCLVANEIEDRAVGGLTGRAGEAFRKNPYTSNRPAPLGPRGASPKPV